MQQALSGQQMTGPLESKDPWRQDVVDRKRYYVGIKAIRMPSFPGSAKYNTVTVIAQILFRQ